MHAVTKRKRRGCVLWEGREGKERLQKDVSWGELKEGKGKGVGGCVCVVWKEK